MMTSSKDVQWYCTTEEQTHRTSMQGMVVYRHKAGTRQQYFEVRLVSDGTVTMCGDWMAVCRIARQVREEGL